MPRVELPDGEVIGGDEEVAGVLDDLRHGVEHEDFGGEFGFFDDHGDGVDDWCGKIGALQENFPNLADIAKPNEEGGESEGKAEGEDVELDDDEGCEKSVPVKLHAIEDGEDEDDTEVDAEIDEGAGGAGNDDDVFGEIDFAEEISTAQYALHALVGGFGEEGPEDLAEEKGYCEVRDALAETEEAHKHYVHDGKHENGLEDGPKMAEERALIAKLEVGFDQFAEEDAVFAGK